MSVKDKPKQPTVSLIVAMAENRVIGYQGKMPWHLPSELQYFKEMTLGKPIIMGRKTFESIGRPLPGRLNIVLTRQSELLPTGVKAACTPEAALDLAQGASEVMVIGGGQVYQAFLALADCLYITHIQANYEGDAFFPEWESSASEVTSKKHSAWKGKEMRRAEAQDGQPGYVAMRYTKI